MPILATRQATTMKECTANYDSRLYGARRRYTVTILAPIPPRAVTLLSQAWAEGALARLRTRVADAESALLLARYWPELFLR